MLQALLDHPDPQANPVNPDNQAVPEMMEPPAKRQHLAHHKTPLARSAPLDHQDPQDPMDKPDLQDRTDSPERRDKEAAKDHQDHPDLPEMPVLQASPEDPDSPARQDKMALVPHRHPDQKAQVDHQDQAAHRDQTASPASREVKVRQALPVNQANPEIQAAMANQVNAGRMACQARTLPIVHVHLVRVSLFLASRRLVELLPLLLLLFYLHRFETKTDLHKDGS